MATVMLRDPAISVVLRSDGKILSEPLKPGLFDGGSVTEITHLMDDLRAIFVTANGDSALVELPSVENSSIVGGRPSVYLDQNHWSTLANAIHAPERVRESERAAATRIIALRRSGEIILPLSSAHLSETLKWRDRSRRSALALTIIQLSSGWQIREDTAVRAHELDVMIGRHFGSSAPPVPPVITLEPYAVQASSAARLRRPSPADFPAGVALSLQALTAISVNFSILLGDESIAITPAVDWARSKQTYSETLHTKPWDAARKRAAAAGFVVDDARNELSRAISKAGIRMRDYAAWLDGGFWSDLAHAPAVQLFSEMMVGRLLNAGTKWTPNDLFDMLSLSNAASYADYAVADRAMVSQAAQALRRLDRPTNVYKNIETLVAVLDA